MEKYFEVLCMCPLFRDIAHWELTKALRCLNARVFSFEKGEAVMNESEPAKYVGIVLTGSFQIVPGELFGESFACAGVEVVPVSVLASEAAEVMLIDCLKISHSCSNACQFHQQMIDNLLQIVAAKNLVLHQKIEVTSKRTTREKLMAYLMLQAKQFGSLEFEIPYDRQELADYLEVERSGLSAEIGKLRRQGVIEADRSRFKIYKPFDV